jgi:hypothetical protein
MNSTVRRFVALVMFACVFAAVGPTLSAETKTQRQGPTKRARQQPTPAPTISSPQRGAQIFAQGERLTYLATLNQLPAGAGEALLRKEQKNGQDVFSFTAKARSDELVDYLYRRRDTAEALFSANGFAPLFFRLASKENDRRREYGVRYDPVTRTLLGSAKRRDRVRERSVPAADVYDPVSAFYLLRSQKMQPGTSLQAEIFTGRGHYRCVARVVGKEIVLVRGREREENLLPKETSVWVSTDATHTPLKIESYLPLGLAVVELENDGFSVRTSDDR